MDRCIECCGLAVIVAMLEFEIRTGLKARASRQSVNALNAVKGLLYLGLVGFAIYWGIDGSPLISGTLFCGSSLCVYRAQSVHTLGGCCVVSGALERPHS